MKQGPNSSKRVREAHFLHEFEARKLERRRMAIRLMQTPEEFEAKFREFIRVGFNWDRFRAEALADRTGGVVFRERPRAVFYALVRRQRGRGIAL